MHKVSMQDIADKVGVSRCTVSLALSGKGRAKRVSEALCDKIIQTAKEMHYEPNELARGLRTGLTKTIGVVVADISNEFFGELSYHIQKRANSLGYNIIIMNSDEAPDKMLDSIRLLINRQVDGIIMVPTNSSIGIANRIVSLGIPFVQVDRFIPGLNSSYVILDNYKASEAVTKKFYSEGCRRIAMVKHATSALNGRLEGYQDFMKAHKIYDKNLVLNIRYSEEEHDLEVALGHLLSLNKKVDAVIFQSHELFLNGIKHIKDREGIRIATFDKSEAYAIVDFPLVYVEQPISKMAFAAVDILVGHINGQNSIEKKVLNGIIRQI
jgi:LacI family transcriptional regulator